MRELTSPPTTNCAECGLSFPTKGNKLTCSLKCAKARQYKQLEQLAKRRRLKLILKEKVKCKFCPTMFIPKHKKNIYCSLGCADRGLEDAVQRQRERSEEEKRLKGQAPS